MSRNSSRREFLKGVPLAAVGAWAGAAGLESLLSPLSAWARPLAAPPQGRPFNMVSLGDSIVWGQGLPESVKFRNLVASWIENQLQGARKVNQFCRAHSGAATGWGVYPAETKGVDPDVFYSKAPGYPYQGEVPWDYPSVSFQIGMAVGDLKARGLTPADVDLVLFDGGANDISIEQVLNITEVDFPANGPNWVRRNTNALVVGHMKSLLPQVINQFPNAAIVMTGYYPPVSESTNLVLLMAYLVILGLPTGVPTAVLTGLGPDVLVDIDMILKGSIAVAPALRSALTLRSQAFAQTALNGFSDLVNQANQGLATPRVALAWPQFSDDNCYGAPSRYLFAAGEYLRDEIRGRNWQAPPGDWSTKQGVAYYRSEQCSKYFPSKPLCSEASIGHPNEFGARAYSAAILEQIETTLAPHLATRGLVENPACAPLRAQEATALGTVRGVQNELAGMGKEQRDCQAGTGPDGRRGPSYKPKQCGALEIEAEKKKLNAQMEQANIRFESIEQQKRQAGCWR